MKWRMSYWRRVMNSDVLLPSSTHFKVLWGAVVMVLLVVYLASMVGRVPVTLMDPAPVYQGQRRQENVVDSGLQRNSSLPGGIPSSRIHPGNPNLPVRNASDPKYNIYTNQFSREEPDTGHPALKKILFWNDIYDSKNYDFGLGRTPFQRARCRVNTCTTTANRSKYPPEALDAVMWHFRSSDKSFPQKRSPHTRYIFWMIESPLHLRGDIRPFNGIFNWTMTYRLDSDLPRPYNHVYRRLVPLHESHRSDYAAGKTKLAAWFASNCATISGREQLVETMKQWIDIDVFGRCGQFECERSHQFDVCYKNLNTTYKFYLSFENSLCLDYITEKFFNILKYDVIPVVYGLGNYSALAPPHSYIDALAFPSAKDLVDYLLYLDKNHTAYNEYFAWKTHYFVPNSYWGAISEIFCDLCERLHTDVTPKKYDLQSWFVKDSKCLTRSTPRVNTFIGEHRYNLTALIIGLLMVSCVLLVCITMYRRRLAAEVH